MNTALLRRGCPFRLVLAGLLLGAGGGLVSADDPAPGKEAAPRPAPEFEARVQPLLRKYCFNCHEGPKAKGDFRLDTLGTDFGLAPTAAAWKEVRERVAGRVMPPKKSPQPTADEARLMTDWVTGQLVAREAAHKVHGRVVLRRLNRVEYENTVRDLLGVPVDIKGMLPEDASADGFDNVGAALRISSVQMQQYLEAADAALDAFFAAGKAPAPVKTKVRFAFKNEAFVKNHPNHARLADGAVAMYYRYPPTGYAPFELRQFYARHDGVYRIRLGAWAHNSDKPVTMALYVGGDIVGYYDVPPERGHTISLTHRMRLYSTIKAVPYGQKWSDKDLTTAPALALDVAEFEGPFCDTWPPAEYQRVVGNVDLKKATPEDLERGIRAFAARAFRRPVRDAELRPFLDLASDALCEQKPESFENALRTGMAAVLCSPHFLFLREKPGKLDDHALASRLSYFLWSTMPDDELTLLASQGRLSNPEVLEDQVERMLRSPRAAAFTENFLGQWLQLRSFDATTPDAVQYPQFDDLLKRSTLRETHAFFEEILKNDLPVQTFIDSDFAMLNRPLAQLYGVPGVDGVEFRKVALPPGSHRGGLMTQASVLKLTANGTDTSPVVRGAWVLKNLLGKPPPPPPPNVAALEPDVRGATTARQKLAKHRQVETCAACHNHIDPIGFALENFDAVGAWRDHYRTNDPRVNKFTESVSANGSVYRYRVGPAVEAADALADGRAFADVDGLKKLLLEDPDQVARCVTEKLLVYATGASVGDADRPAVEALVKKVKARKYGLRTLIHELVQSELFLNK